MVLYPQFEITITTQSGEVRKVRGITDIKVTLSQDDTSDDAKITIPTAKISDLKRFQKDDEIEIKLGFKDQRSELETVFTGYITSISTSLPMVITAQDEYYKAKEIKKILKDTLGTTSDPVTYKKVAEEILEGFGEKLIPDTPEGSIDQNSVAFPSETVAECLEELCRLTSWTSFCVPGYKTVYVGPPNPEMITNLESKKDCYQKVFYYRVGSQKGADDPWGNIISVNDLFFEENEDCEKIKQETRAICEVYDRNQRFKSVTMVAPENKRINPGEEVPGAERIRIPYTYKNEFPEAIPDAEDFALIYATRRHRDLKKKRITGSFTTFGNPHLAHSAKIKLEWAQDYFMSSHNGFYEVTKVVHNYSSQGGYRMTVHFQKWIDE